MSYSVYKHTFPNEKVYIGITSRRPEARWRKNGSGYLFKDKNGNYTQYLIARAIQKYGWDNIQHEVLFKGLTKKEAEQKEIELIAYYKSNQKEFGYNIQNGGNTYGTHSEEAKKKIGEANKKRIWKEESKRKISEANKGKKHLQEKTKAFKEAVSKANKNRVWTEEAKNSISEAHKKSVICVETNVVYESIKEATNKTGITHISEVCNGRAKTAGGYHWEYIDNQLKNKALDFKKSKIDKRKRRVKCVEKNTIYESMISAERETGISAIRISSCCNGYQKTTGGYHWEFVEEKEN